MANALVSSPYRDESRAILVSSFKDVKVIHFRNIHKELFESCVALLFDESKVHESVLCILEIKDEFGESHTKGIAFPREYTSYVYWVRDQAWICSLEFVDGLDRLESNKVVKYR